jgi:threonine aldolase
VDDGDEPDVYGVGGAVTRLEERVAGLLGKEAAVLMPTGSMASQVALRLHADARACRTVAFHPRAHVEVHERKGYAVVHGLTGLLLGDSDRLVTTDDLLAVREPLAAVLWELPQRDLGGLLPEWDDLVAQTTWARERGIAAHLDGARLWEAQPCYGRPHAEIAALFDTVYVSLYKGLEGLAGALLAGPADHVAQAREWRARLGGQLHNAWPLAVAAEIGLDALLPRMPAFWERAKELAAAIGTVPGVEVVPDPPQTPLFHVLVHAPKDALQRAHTELVESRGVELFRYARTTTSPRWSRFELTVGENAMAFGVDEVRELITELAGRATDGRP